ncbi:MAG: NUDIX domain-containing protein, partial [Candidatus Diapherotrites archaeon]|nr:NUDIX domain-containing protein [Candidatus Diapherotrites archaeon]
TVEKALKREVLEETNLHIKNEKLLASYEIIHTAKVEIIGLAFVCEIAGGKLKLSDEHEEFKWLSFSEALKLKNKKITELVKKANKLI